MANERKESLALILFSGLAADDSVFIPQRLAFPKLIVPKWPIPQDDESLTAYCERLAEPLKSHRPCVLGGASFGGIVALEVAKFLKPAAVVLIGSVRSPEELPRRVRIWRPLAPLISWLPVRFLQCAFTPFTWKWFRRLAPHLAGVTRQFCQSDPAVFKWSLRRLLVWNSAPELPCPVIQIHGRRDFILPCGCTRPDHMIEGGGHVISLTHGGEVNAVLAEVLAGRAAE